MPGPLLAVDAPFLLYRSFFALPDTIQGADGRPVNALLGAANVLLRIAADRGPARDRGLLRRRGGRTTGSSSTRPTTPTGRRSPTRWPGSSSRRRRSSRRSAGRRRARTDLEADDLLGSLAHAEAAAGGEALILTGDRDMYQCAGDRVTRAVPEVGDQRLRGGRRRPRCSGATGSRRSWCPTSSRCAAIPPTACPARPGSGRRPPPSCCSATARSRTRSPARREERPRIAAALTEPADELRAFREIATLQALDVERPAGPRRPTWPAARRRPGARTEPAGRAAREREQAADLLDEPRSCASGSLGNAALGAAEGDAGGHDQRARRGRPAPG